MKGQVEVTTNMKYVYAVTAIHLECIPPIHVSSSGDSCTALLPFLINGES